MALEPATDPSRLYSAVGPEVSPYRPLFTGDIFTCVEDTRRRYVGSHRDRTSVLVPGQERQARRTDTGRLGSNSRAAPSPALVGGVLQQDALGRPAAGGQLPCGEARSVRTCPDSDLFEAERIACLSHAGINQLQQRLVFHQTRLAVPAAKFHEAFDHTYGRPISWRSGVPSSTVSRMTPSRASSPGSAGAIPSANLS